MWRALYLSFYSKAFYRDVAQNWRNLALSYLFLVVLLYCIPFTLTANQAYRTFIDTEGQALIEKMPVMTFKNHTLSISESQPYLIQMGDHYENTDKPMPSVIFDRTGQYKLENLYARQVLFTDRYIHIRNNAGDIRSLPFEKLPADMVIGHEELHQLANLTKRWFMPVFFVVIMVSLYIFRILQVLVYGLIGMLFNRIMGAYLEYPQLVRLSAIAITPVLVIDTVLSTLSPGVVFGPFVGFLVAMGYLIFGIRANRELIT